MMKIPGLVVFISSIILYSPAFGEPSVISLDGIWTLRHDPENIGKAESWWDFPGDKERLVEVPVPGTAQLVMPDKRGVFWYYRTFAAPENPHPQGRYVLRLWQADYYADVWLNGQLLGSHEGSETPFEFDVTEAISPGAVNRLAVRIVNSMDSPIDGIVLRETAHRNRTPWISAGSDVTQGGLTDSVELLIVPAIRVKDIFVRPNFHTGEIAVRTTLEGPVDPRPFIGKNVAVTIDVAPALGGETLLHHAMTVVFSPENPVIEMTLQLNGFRPWDVDDPYMYRVSVRTQLEGENGFSELSTRSGFRDFRFENGAFRLNGRRIFLKCSHSGADTPIGLRVPLDREMLRKDVIFCKTMGFNAIRYIAGMPPRMLLEQCDENGMLVYNECFAAWCMGLSDHFERRFIDATREMILRDRNHPSVVIWGLINEMT
ncbi:MAG: hypothetical protein FWH27_14805, partial [Planctomycetaceae bacterium]|nr:hypothetical protein [Planctomycetaceae bacterium]